jgi:hypothetical protein
MSSTPEVAIVAVERTPRAYILLLLPTLIPHFQQSQALRKHFGATFATQLR